MSRYFFRTKDLINICGENGIDTRTLNTLPLKTNYSYNLNGKDVSDVGKKFRPTSTKLSIHLNDLYGLTDSCILELSQFQYDTIAEKFSKLAEYNLYTNESFRNIIYPKPEPPLEFGKFVEYVGYLTKKILAV